jgi:hypothetical protein
MSGRRYSIISPKRLRSMTWDMIVDEPLYGVV